MEHLIELLAQFLAVIPIITLHEFAHAFVAYKNGDPTAKFSGRMTLNPLKHFDPLGILAFALVGFGWAKPVPVNPNNFKNYKRGCFWTSAAGVIVNYLTAFLAFPLYLLIFKYVLAPATTYTNLHHFINIFFYCLFAFSLSLCVFNLLPFYPLDGFRMLDSFAKRRGKVYWFLYKNGRYVLYGLILLSILADYLGRLNPLFYYFDILGYVMRFATDIFGYPIQVFWRLIIR